jgi:hypothetical protein
MNPGCVQHKSHDECDANHIIHHIARERGMQLLSRDFWNNLAGLGIGATKGTADYERVWKGR